MSSFCLSVFAVVVNLSVCHVLFVVCCWSFSQVEHLLYLVSLSWLAVVCCTCGSCVGLCIAGVALVCVFVLSLLLLLLSLSLVLGVVGDVFFLQAWGCYG